MSNQSFLTQSPAELQRNLDDFNRRSAEEEIKAKAKSLGLAYIDLHNFPVDLNVLGMFTKEEAEELKAVPFYRENKDLRVGAVNPLSQPFKEKIKELSLRFKVNIYLISELSLMQTMKFFSKVMRPKPAHDEVVRVEKEVDYGGVFKNLQDEDIQKKKTASELLEAIFGAAMYYKASDIHLEPEEHFFKLRFRLDGVLQDMLHFSKDLQHNLVMRIKVLSKLKLNVDAVPQDGRITFYYLGQPIDVRVSSLPSAYGEEFVMRLLGMGAVNLKLKDLGFRPQHEEILNRQLNKPNGMVITTGPTGSGKTTTLYAFLNQLNEPGVKIITLEDPVEYKLEGIVQTPIDHSHDFSFAKGLRAILRQDPDIIMVGEIRDQETAETATQAALTGHLVLSTLHTNDAAGAIPRLLNMGVKPFVLGPAINLVMAQRLVRRVCQECKTKVALSPMVMEKIIYLLKQLPPKSGIKAPKEPQFYHSTGCAACHKLGYKGRVGIYEVLENTEEVQKLMTVENVSMTDFRKQAFEQGMITMLQDGLLKALDGITDVEEVFRVAGEG